MKRFVFFILLFSVISGLNVDAQTKEERFRERFPYKYEFRIGYGGTPMHDTNLFMSTGCDCNFDIIPSGPASLGDLYRPQMAGTYVSGVFSAEFSVHFRRWFTLSFNLGVNGMWGKQYDPLNDVYSKKSGASFNLIPVARFHWINRKVVRLYSSVGLGLYTGFYGGESECTAAGLFVPVGISLGKKVFFFAEPILSTASFGANAGVGVRF